MNRGITVASVCCAAAALAGCGGSDGFQASSSASTPSVSSRLANLLAFNTTDPGPAPAKEATRDNRVDCPMVEVQDGTASYRSYGGADQANGNVKYQFSMGDVVRECSRTGDDITIKVGVEGRVLLGPVGQPGSFTVPIRIAVRRDIDQKPAASKLYQVAASIPFGQTQGAFTLVSEPMAVPFTKIQADEDYTILVGFDDHGGPAERKAPLKPKRKGAPG